MTKTFYPIEFKGVTWVVPVMSRWRLTTVAKFQGGYLAAGLADLLGPEQFEQFLFDIDPTIDELTEFLDKITTAMRDDGDDHE